METPRSLVDQIEYAILKATRIVVALHLLVKACWALCWDLNP